MLVLLLLLLVLVLVLVASLLTIVSKLRVDCSARLHTCYMLTYFLACVDPFCVGQGTVKNSRRKGNYWNAYYYYYNDDTPLGAEPEQAKISAAAQELALRAEKLAANADVQKASKPSVAEQKKQEQKAEPKPKPIVQQQQEKGNSNQNQQPNKVKEVPALRKQGKGNQELFGKSENGVDIYVDDHRHGTTGEKFRKGQKGIVVHGRDPSIPAWGVDADHLHGIVRRRRRRCCRCCCSHASNFLHIFCFVFDDLNDVFLPAYTSVFVGA